MSPRAARTSSRSGGHSASRWLATSAFIRIAASGWLISWAMVCPSCPTVDTRATCARSWRICAASRSARLRRTRLLPNMKTISSRPHTKTKVPTIHQRNWSQSDRSLKRTMLPGGRALSSMPQRFSWRQSNMAGLWPTTTGAIAAGLSPESTRRAISPVFLATAPTWVMLPPTLPYPRAVSIKLKIGALATCDTRLRVADEEKIRPSPSR